MTYRTGDTFVPNGESRQDTAVLLVGAALDHGLSQQGIHAVSGGFYISDELAAVLYAEDEQAPAKSPGKAGRTKKASGNRAAKNTSTGTDKE